MCKYLLQLIGFNADEPEDYYDSNHNSKMKLSIILLFYINSIGFLAFVSKILA